MPIDFEAFEAYIESDGEIEFDPYAQNPDDWAILREIIPELIISSAGGLMPFQAEGLIEGYPFYYRDKYGSASLSVGATDGERPYLGDTTLWVSHCESVDGAEGKIFSKNIVNLIQSLEKSPFPYEFEGYALRFQKDKSWDFAVDKNEKTRTVGWGHSPEEAYLRIFEPSAYLEKAGCSTARQLEMTRAREFDKTPVVTDERVYPSILPNFLKRQ